MQNKLLFILFLTFVLPVLTTAQQIKKNTFKHAGLTREYIFYAPENLPENAPLVVVLHGYTSSAEKIMKYSEMNALANENHFAVVYPQGSEDDSSKTFWNVGYDFHVGNTTDDVDFIVKLVQDLQKKYSLSVKNTFVTGMSNGGDMSYLLACRHPKVFASIAPVVGTMMENYFKNCNTENPIPVFALNGTNDNTTSFNGDMENKEGWGAYQSVPFIINFWAEAMDCASVKKDTLPDTNKTDGSFVISEQYLNSQTGKEVLFYKVVNGGHDWPGAWGNLDIDASREIWRFFEKYKR